MKYKSLRSLIACFLFVSIVQQARSLDLGVSYAAFQTPDGKPYVEVNIEIAAVSILYQKTESEKLQAGAEILILIKKGDEIANYEKYNIQSPLVDAPQSLLDVKRLAVPEGDYTLEVAVQDLNATENKDHFSTPISVRFPKQIHLSEIQLLRSFKRDDSENPFAKNGYFLEPLPFNFYDRGAVRLAFYGEIYHSNKNIAADAEYLVRYYIEQEKGNGIKSLISTGSQRKKPSEIDALLVQMDISKLESGNYTLTVEIRNAANEALATRQLTFQRSNPYLNVQEIDLTDEALAQQFTEKLEEKELKYVLASLSPIVAGDDAEVLNNVARDKDLKNKRYFIFRHFVRQDPNNPEEAFNRYMELAKFVDKRFYSGFRRGFETDRGRTYLRFGAPDDLVHVEDEPGAAPYEIWVYYSFPKTKQSNVKFLFYNPSLAGEDYIMLHSTARGEIQDPKWERKLYNRNVTEYVDGDNYHDGTNLERNLGRRAKEYFTDF
ncbi:MAG: GWxTD domain-containing protein [Saprospiraceae bacterium]|nr:GWxTD domain-containing protein [Saprospiraceae bacterium]